MNLRSRLAHGQLRYRNANYLNTVLTLFDILKCIITLNSAEYLDHYVFPNGHSPHPHITTERSNSPRSQT